MSLKTAFNTAAAVIPDCLKALPRYGICISSKLNASTKRDCLIQTMMSIVRVATAYGFFRLTERMIGAATFAAAKDHKLMTAGLLASQYLVSAPAMLIHLGGVAIRNNLPVLFKAWTEKSFNTNTAVGLGLFAFGVFLLSSTARGLAQWKDGDLYDFGAAELLGDNLAYTIAKKVH